MKKRVLFCCMLIACCGLSLQAQSGGTFDDKTYKARIGMRMMELEMDDFLSLWFTDANTGRPLAGAQVFIEEVGTLDTDKDGLAIFDVPEDGNYTFSVTKNGYIPFADTFDVMLGTIIFNKFSVPPIIPLEQVKIVLDWNSSPADLDLHLVKDGAYHISYRDKRKADDGSAWLDRDDTDGYGPETITIGKVDPNAVYHIYVHDYTNRSNGRSSKMAASSATVRIYVRNRLEKKFTIPVGKTGVTWRACDFLRNVITPVNTVQ